MKKLLFLGLVSFTTVLMLFSCSGSKSTGKGQGDITSMEWRLISVKSVDGSKDLTPATGTLPTLLVSKDGNISGSTGCNRYNGPVTIDGYSLKFGNIVSTKMYCENAATVEYAFTTALSSTDNYTVEKGNLLLKKGTEVVATLSSFR